MAEAAKTSRVTNEELLREVLAMQKQLNGFMAADGYGGRLLLAERQLRDNTDGIRKLDKAQEEMRVGLQEVRQDVKTTLAIVKWVITPIFGFLVVIVGNILLGQ